MLVNAGLSEQTQAHTFGKVTHLLDVANQLMDHLDAESEPASEQEPDTFNGKSLLDTFKLILHTALTRPDSLARHYADFASSVLQVLSRESDRQPDPADRRFKDKLWQDNGFFHSLMQIYLAWDEHIQAWIREQTFTPADRQRVAFILNQLVAALSPSNLPINPSALKRAENTEGKSAVKGLLNWINDICFNQSMPRQVSDSAYEVGVSLATTPGQVVYRNEQLELIQYQPQTSQVHRRPVLLVPPQINKYYVFDLKQKNSILGYLVKQELQMFVISWRNPNHSESHWGLDVYVNSLLQAINAIRSITRSKTVGLISACAGGLTASALLGYLAETGNPVVRNHSLLVTALTPNNDSVLELFTTRKTLQFARAHSRIEGVMDGKALARVFAWLRPDDLVWKYWVNNYLMGREPPPLDVLYWDNDATRLPAQLHSDFLTMYERDVFHHPHRHQVLGEPVDYSKVRVDTYVAAGREDYLMPWRGVFKATQIFRGKHRFVLSTSGHVQSILRPPSLAHTEYFINDDIPASADAWLASAQRREGTWWNDWMTWLKAQSGARKRAPVTMGNKDYPPITPAPGDYVRERI